MERARHLALTLLVAALVALAAARALWPGGVRSAPPPVHGVCVTLRAEELPAPLLLCEERGEEDALAARAAAAAGRHAALGQGQLDEVRAGARPWTRIEVGKGEGRALTRPLAPATELVLGRRMDLCAATAEELRLLPGIGPARARAIVAHRESGGRLGSARDLTRIRGIGAVTARRLEPLVRCGGELPRGAARGRLP